MEGRNFEFHDGEKGAAIAVHIKRKKGTSCFQRVQKDGSVVVQMETGGGDLNEKLIKFLASELNIPRKKFQIIAGEDGSKKLISILDTKPKQVQKRILELIS